MNENLFNYKILFRVDMGKSKKRNLLRNNEKTGSVIKRQNVVSDVITAIRKNNVSDEIIGLISLFGITADELSEAGASFEELSAVQNVII